MGIRIIVNDAELEDSGLDSKDFIALIAISKGLSVNLTSEHLEKLRTLGFIGSTGRLLQKGIRRLNDMMMNSEGNNDLGYYMDVAIQLMEYWPEGLKDEKWPWKDDVDQTVRRLRLFERQFGRYEAQDIVDCGWSYVKTYEDDDTYMCTLRNFILNDRKSPIESKLASLLSANNCQKVTN